MIFTIPFKTPTINHLYWHRGNIKIMTKDARDLKKEIIEIIHSQQVLAPISSKPADTYLRVEVDVYEDWHTIEGYVKKKDIANREKFLIDCVFEGLGIDDKFIFIQTMRKVQSCEEKSVIKIEVIENWER